ncbi:MAG: hypothetical protein ACR2MG_21070 [Pyrinomonadaceae bacterium]
MKTKKEKTQESDEAATAQNTEIAPAVEAVSDEDFPGELNQPRWSVVSFETCIANSLTYDEATQKLKGLAAKKVSGLCLITDEAANRITN